MSKIKLSIENLSVESFATADAEQGRGTILGNAKTIDGCASVQETACGPECYTWYLAGCPSAMDECPSSPHSMTLPCNGCVETAGICMSVIEIEG